MGLTVFSTGVFCAGLVIGICIGVFFACIVFCNCRLRTLDREPAEKMIETWQRVTK